MSNRMTDLEAWSTLDDLIRRYEDGLLNYDDYDESCRLARDSRRALTVLAAALVFLV